MNLQQRIDLMEKLGSYLLSDDEEWQSVKNRAANNNGWFIPEFINLACNTIANRFLERGLLTSWVNAYQLPATNSHPRTVGIVMAGNIPLVGFHDLLCVFISGHKALIKPSGRDDVLIKHLVAKLTEWNAEVKECIGFAEMLRHCDAYIATGSNNSAGYFEYYFARFPHIIRRNRTSIAILDGHETEAGLSALADDVYLYFGRGCRNVTKIFVPEGYDFVPLLSAFKKYNWLADHHKYKNNYDYNLAIHLLNKKYYMSNESLLLVEEPSVFSPISQLNYGFYTAKDELLRELKKNNDIQCVVSAEAVPFRKSQMPSLSDYADGIDTLHFLQSLTEEVTAVKPR